MHQRVQDEACRDGVVPQEDRRSLDDRGLQDHPQRVESHVREKERGERQGRALRSQRGKGEAREHGQRHQVGVVVLSPAGRLSEGGEPACALALR